MFLSDDILHGYMQQRSKLYHFNTKNLMKHDQNVPIYNIEEMLWLTQISFVVSFVFILVQMIVQNLFASLNGGYAMSSITSPILGSGGSFWMRNNAPAPRRELSIACFLYFEFGTRSFLWTQTFCNLGQEAESVENHADTNDVHGRLQFSKLFSCCIFVNTREYQIYSLFNVQHSCIKIPESSI